MISIKKAVIDMTADFLNYARSTAPLLRQEVQTYIFFAPPSVFTLTDLMFGFHILFDLLCEWLTALPNSTDFPQTEHFAMVAPPLLKNAQFVCYQKYTVIASLFQTLYGIKTISMLIFIRLFQEENYER